MNIFAENFHDDIFGLLLTKMKKSIIVLIAASLFLPLLSCQSAEQTGDLTTVINDEPVMSIKVITSPELFSPVVFTRTEDIEKIVNYLKELDIGEKIDKEEILGMAYYIEVLYSSGTSQRIVLDSNMYITIDGAVSYALSYKEASAFDTVIGSLLINKYRAEHTGTILIGEVISVDTDSSERNIACTVRTDGGQEVYVNLDSITGAILDITGSGWLILHVYDEVEIGINSDGTADRVFITKAAG